jgi:hypothetical protein
MNRFASHNPELYEQMVERHGTIEEAFRANADVIRTEQKEGRIDGPDDCVVCGEPAQEHSAWCKRCAAALEEDRMNRELGR